MCISRVASRPVCGRPMATLGRRCIQARCGDRRELRARLVRAGRRVREQRHQRRRAAGRRRPAGARRCLARRSRESNLVGGAGSIRVGAVAIDWDWTAAEAALRQAVALDPSSAAAVGTLGHALSQSGHRAEATAVTQAARDPTSETHPRTRCRHRWPTRIATGRPRSTTRARRWPSAPASG